MELIVNALQFMGGIILSIGYIPQIRRIVKTKSVNDFDFKYLLSLTVGVGLMEIYAIYNALNGIALMFLVTNTIALALAATVLILYLKFRVK